MHKPQTHQEIFNFSFVGSFEKASEVWLPVRLKKLANNLESFHLFVDNEHALRLLENNPVPANKKWSAFLDVDVGYLRGRVTDCFQIVMCHCQWFNSLFCNPCSPRKPIAFSFFAEGVQWDTDLCVELAKRIHVSQEVTLKGEESLQLRKNPVRDARLFHFVTCSCF